MAQRFPDSAKAILKQYLDRYGLGSLSGWAWDVWTDAGGGDIGMDAINAELPTTAEFKARFPAYDQLAKAGRAMSVAEMLAYETTARQIFKSAGMPAGFYDSPDDLAKFMLNDVSAAELEARVRDAQVAAYSSSPTVREELTRLYGVKSGELTAFFVDPQRALPLIQQQFTASRIAAEAQDTAYGTLERRQAEYLAREGVTAEQAQAGFTELGLNRGLFEQQTTGEYEIGMDEQLAGQFSGNVEAHEAFRRRQRRRQAMFEEESGFGVTQRGVSGLAPSNRGI